MALQLSYTSSAFKLIGDGSTTSVDISLFDFPFVDMPKRIPAAIFLQQDGSGNLVSAVISGSIVTLTFTSTWSGDSQGPIQFVLYFDLP